MTIKHCNFNGFFILTDENQVYLSVPQFTLEISTSIHITSLSLNFYIYGQEQDFFLKLSPKFMLLDKHLKTN